MHFRVAFPQKTLGKAHQDEARAGDLLNSAAVQCPHYHESCHNLELWLDVQPVQFGHSQSDDIEQVADCFEVVGFVGVSAADLQQMQGQFQQAAVLAQVEVPLPA